MLRSLVAVAAILFAGWSFSARAEISVGPHPRPVFDALADLFIAPEPRVAVRAAALADSKFWTATYNGRTFKVGCEGDFCGLLLPVNAAARSTRYVEWAFTYLEGCYGSDALCNEIDKVVGARLGIGEDIMKAMRQVYRETKTEIVRRIRGNKSDWKMLINNPPGGYVACNYRWNIKGVRGNASIVVFPDASPGVGVWGAAVAQGDKGSWIEGALYIRYVKKALHAGLVRSGTCLPLSGRFKINANNVDGRLP